MLSQLNPIQREAVEHTEGPLLILAGAGSGKTRVLTCRMAHLIREKKVKPWNLFAVTFTNKAAQEMKMRVGKLLGSAVHEMWVSTFHSASLRILRSHAGEMGYKTDFTIYDDKEQLQLIHQCFEELKINPQSFNPKVVAHRINEAKHNGISTTDFERMNSDFFGERVALVYSLYQKKLNTNQAMDFGDLILNTVLLFKTKPAILSHYQNFFSHLHVDEYQDTNRSQYELIHLLGATHRNVCVVGDDDQSIYKFRGAEIKNILDFQKDYPEAHVVRLEQNYRSTQNILKAASTVVAKNSRRMGKTLWTDNAVGESLTLFQAEGEQQEAAFIVEKIIEHKKAGTSYLNQAIFYRTNAQSRPFEDELRKRAIPYLIIGGTKFYDRLEIKDILAYLKLLVNPADSISLKRVINVPPRGIGKTTMEKLEAVAAQNQLSVWEILSTPDFLSDFSAGTLSKLRQFTELIQTLDSERKQISLIDFMTTLFDKTGYWKMLKDEKTVEAESRLENLEEFVNVIEEHVRQNNENATLESFLDQAALISDLDKYEPDADRLPLMTFHLAKGLEFPVVYMVGMEEGLFPHSRSLASDDDLEEERRLCYVGMTRAMEKLTISFARRRRIFGTEQFHLPSRFLEEIPEELLDVVEPPRSSFPRINDEYDSSSSIDDDYDQRSDEEKMSQKIQRSIQSAYARGARVRHPVFGMGIVRSCEGEKGNEKLTISFENGVLKKILVKYANLAVL